MKILLLIVYSISFVFANTFDFKLQPIQLSQNTYYFYGKEEYFSKQNGGDIANSAFIITDKSVILIDTGSSVGYAEQMKKEIYKITKKPIKHIINTHHHPDHFLGNNAFKTSDIYASMFTTNEIIQNGDLYIVNLVQIVNEAMKNTEIKSPNKVLSQQELILDSYKLKILHFEGHTKSDIVIYDENTKILFASDLIFNQRAIATTHANIDKWVDSLNQLEKIDYKILVPGHGIASKTKDPIKGNISYLKFLDSTLTKSAKLGLNVFEILNQEVPKDIRNYSMFEEEFERSIINLFPYYEAND
jgi:quinoprotein relay system zinc metallohydrolase 1